MATITKNLSHRRLFKEKNRQLIQLNHCPKTSYLLKQEANVHTRINQQKQYQTTESSNKQRDTSLSNRLTSEAALNSKIGSNSDVKDNHHIKSNRMLVRRSNSGKFKSLEAMPKKKQNSIVIKKQFSIKRIERFQARVSQQKPTSLENIELKQSPAKIECKAILKSAGYLKQTLKKTSTNKLKIKVKDPFEKRTKLDFEFKDESVISKGEESFISTMNQHQFMALLSIIV